MWERLDEGGVDREDWVKEMRQVNPLRFRDEAEKRAVSVEAPWTALLDDLYSGFVVTVQKFISYSTGRCLVGEL